MLCYFTHTLPLPFIPHTAKATFDAITKTYSYLTPDLWSETKLTKDPYQEYTDYLSKTQKVQPLATPE